MSEWCARILSVEVSLQRIARKQYARLSDVNKKRVALAPLIVHVAEEYDDEYITEQDLADSDKAYDEYLKDHSTAIPLSQVLSEEGININELETA
jgi:ABC-type Na+ transport system ATPase subunit NatA